MDNSNGLSYYVEDDTYVFNVTNENLSQFMKTIDEIERGGYVRDQGMFKLKVCESSRAGGSKPHEVLNILKPYFKGKCVLQEVRKYPLCDNLGYRALSGNTVLSRKFAKKMSRLSVYSSPETCCSQILKSESPKAVVDHWFAEAKTFCIETRSKRSHQISDIEEEQRILIENGKKLKVQYEEVLLSTNTIAECRKKKDVHRYCNCEDCFVQSDPEEDSDDENSQANSAQLSNSQPSKYPAYAAGIQLKNNGNSVIKVTKDFCMSNLASVLDLFPKVYQGLQIPYYYVGEEHSFFAAHTEDCALYAANYLHLGFPKIWVAVSSKYCDKVRGMLKSLRMDLNHTSCANSLNHKYFIFTLQFFDSLNVPYQITAQHKGEMVILKPDVLHLGFNSGPHVSEAVNFGTVTWIPEGVKSMKWRCRCFGDECIHLDMKPLVAAFYPEMLQSLYDCSVVNCMNLQHTSVSKKVEAVQRVAGNDRVCKIYECPESTCSVQFVDHRQRLIDHLSSHEKRAELLKQFEVMYPKKSSGSTTGLVCSVCNRIIAGSSTHLEKHYKRQMKNKELDEEMKKLYSDALKVLEQTVKRRKRSVKIVETDDPDGPVNLN